MVLSVLLIAEHNLGVWGLLLAVPGTVFFLDYLVRYPNQSLKEVGERELSVIKKKVPRETASPTSSTDEGPAGAPGLKPVLQGG